MNIKETRWQSRRTCTHLLLRELQNFNSLLNNHPQENVGSHQKRIPHVQGQRISPSNMVGGAKSHVESNSLPARDTQRAQTKPCAHQETPQRLSQNCLWVSPVKVWVSSGLPQGQGLWVQQTWVCHKPSWRRLLFTPTQSTRTYTRLGKQILGGHKQNLVGIRTQEKGEMTLQETDPDLGVSVQESLAEVCVSGGMLQGRGHWVQQCIQGIFWRRSSLSSLPPP